MARRRGKKEINIFGNAAFMDAMANTVGALIFLLLMVVVVTVALKLNYFDIAIKTPVRLPDAVAHKQYDVVLAGFGGNQPYKWRVLKGLPQNGLVLDPEKAMVRETRQQRDYEAFVPHVHGTPEEATNVPIVFEVEMSDTPVVDEKTGKVIIERKSTTRRFELAVQPASYSPPILAVKTTSLPVAALGKEYSVVLSAVGGEPPYRWTAEGVPPDDVLKLDGSDGRFSGAPSRTGEWRMTLTVHDKSGASAHSQLVLFKVANYRDADEVKKEMDKLKKPLRIATRTLPDAILNRPYELMLAAEGGIPPYKWSSCGSADLRGLGVSPDGRLVGTPKATALTLKACVQSEGGETAESTELRLNVVVVPPPPPPPPPLKLFSSGPGGAQ